jgi:hypothetical protein
VKDYKKFVLSGPLGHLPGYAHASGPRSTSVDVRPGAVGSLASAARLRLKWNVDKEKWKNVVQAGKLGYNGAKLE